MSRSIKQWVKSGAVAAALFVSACTGDPHDPISYAVGEIDEEQLVVQSPSPRIKGISPERAAVSMSTSMATRATETRSRSFTMKSGILA